MAIFRPIAAFFTGIVAGVSENLFDKSEDVIQKEEKDHCGGCGDEEKDEPHQHTLSEKFRFGMKFAFLDLLGDIAKWFLLGIALAGVISYFVPATFIMDHLSGGWQAYGLVLFVGIPLYICASASTPIAAALILKGMSPGVALVFLLVGPATNIATILMVGKFLGRRAAVIYLVAIAISAIACGLLLNQIYIIAGINIQATVGQATEVIPHIVKLVSAFLVIILMGNAIWYYEKKKLVKT